MEEMLKKVSYLQGLAEGMKLGESAEGKVIAEMLDLLEDMADAINDLGAEVADLSDYVDAVDSDLADVEDELFGEDEEADECDCGCEDDYVSVICPDCGEEICFDASIVDDEDMIDVTCPNCDAVVYSNYDEDEDDECGCGCEDEDEEE